MGLGKLNATERERDQYHGQRHLSKQTLAALTQAEINAHEQMEQPPELGRHIEWSHLTSAALNTSITPSPQAQDARAPDPHLHFKNQASK